VSYAYAVKSGPWIFLTGHEAFDFVSGIPEEVAGPSGFPLFGRSRSRREGDFTLQRMRRILQEFGTDLGNGVRLDQYYPTPVSHQSPVAMPDVTTVTVTMKAVSTQHSGKPLTWSTWRNMSE
jgi:hypothetical protein